MNNLITNPLFIRNKLPLFSKIKAEDISPAINYFIKENKKLIKKLSLLKNPSWDNFVRPLEVCDERLNRVWSQASHLNAVINNDNLRKAYNNNAIKISKYYSELSQNEQLQNNFLKLRNHPDFKKLSKTRKKIINDELLNFKLGGVQLSPNKKTQFKKIKSELTKLSSKFQDNILDSTNEFILNILDKGQLQGLPKEIIKAAKETAVALKKNGWVFTLNFPSYIPFMQYADNRLLRKNFYFAYATKASELANKKYDNTKVINKTLALRLSQANILGYSNYAEMTLETKMAKSSKEITDFLRNLAKKAMPFAKKDIQELELFALNYGIAKIEAWDVSYLSEKLKQSKFDFSDNELKKYFPQKKVLKGLFNVTKKLYGVNIQKQKADVWHDDVEFYEIRDSKKKLIGQFYLDLYARKNKRGGAWMDEAICKHNLDETPSLPVAFLTCNFSSPSKNKQAYFTHDEVITLFHEFGHGLHHMLTEIDDYSVSGIKGVEWDAVELPSQFMENFCWNWKVIQDMTEHETTKDKLPKSFFEKLINAKNFQSGIQTLRQIEFALFDILLHSGFNPLKKNFLTLLEQVRDEVAVIKPPSWNRFPHSFSHIFAGGYAAGYYSYKWAELLSADAFDLFEEKNVFSKKIGELFRKEILARGGSRSALESFVAFRGRKPNIKALLRHSGLAN
ncbi:MAG: M3 family metallopeptidase [Proteobacteria bacterium]|nr:M3 family metallopeptidase [Pseudomonadota bacterium]